MLKVKIKIRGVLLRDKARLYACTALAAKTVVLPDPKTPRTLCSRFVEYIMLFCLSEYLYGSPSAFKCSAGDNNLLKFSYITSVNSQEGLEAIIRRFLRRLIKSSSLSHSFPIKSMLYLMNV